MSRKKWGRESLLKYLWAFVCLSPIQTLYASASIDTFEFADQDEFHVQGDTSYALYDFDGNSECPTEDDGPVVISPEGVFSDFTRSNVDCFPGDGVFRSTGWPTSEGRVDTLFVGFSGEAPAEAPLTFPENARITFSVSRSSEGPVYGELLYIRDTENAVSVGTWTLDETTFHHMTFPVGQLAQYGSAGKAQFRFLGWGAASESGRLTFDDISLSFAIAASSEKPPEQPDRFEVASVYPNPFTTATTLLLRVDRSTYVRLEVFDVLGRLHTIAYDGLLTRGEHRIRINGAQLPPGVYLLRASSIDWHTARRMIRR
ncbi:MAG TPA: T9SS type A sorting domain-containing protein [Thermomicrobiales bacterium]|nr:T9SS type A sorting domain-containing protein [Thermomicrobiales bacterium]